MFPFIEIFGRQLPSYGVLGITGIVLGLLLALLRCKRYNLDRENCAFIYIFGAIGTLLCAKILYLITVFSDFVRDFHLLWENPKLFYDTYLSGGLVFYGGLAGAFLGAFLCAKYFSVRLRDYFPAFIPVFPLIHAIGRVGCFAVGCCYGAPADWGIAFTNSPVAPNGVKLVPVQLFEAGAELIICVILLLCARRWVSSLRLLGIYLVAYAPVRYVLEFFRGDEIRGFVLNISTSQWISILVFAIGIVLIYMSREKAKPVAETKNT